MAGKDVGRDGDRETPSENVCNITTMQTGENGRLPRASSRSAAPNVVPPPRPHPRPQKRRRTYFHGLESRATRNIVSAPFLPGDRPHLLAICRLQHNFHLRIHWLTEQARAHMCIVKANAQHKFGPPAHALTQHHARKTLTAVAACARNRADASPPRTREGQAHARRRSSGTSGPSL